MQDKYGNHVKHRDVVIRDKDGKKIQIVSSSSFSNNVCLGITIETPSKEMVVLNVDETKLLPIEKYPEYYL
jgi:ABC-type histidine transport system ATPase subunit